MRIGGRDAAAILLMISVAGCVDPGDVAQRAAAGAVLGAGVGAGLGAAFAVNPGFGAALGAAGGGVAGAAVGVVSAEPAISYGPITARDTAAVPGFYDSWPPGYSVQPVGLATPPAPPSPTAPGNGALPG